MSSIAIDARAGIKGPTLPRARHALRPLLRRTAVVAFTLQFLFMATWSAIQYSRFALTSDASTYFQAFYLLSHGVLDPISSTHRIPFIQDHFELLAWPLSIFDWVGPPGLTMLWVQDLFIVLSEVAGFAWMCNVVRSRQELEATFFTPTRLLGLGLVLLIANPWSYWAIAFDVHIETFAIVFAVMAAFEFSRGRGRRGWIWAVLLLFCGDVPSTWVIGLGLSALIAGRHSGGSVVTRYRQGVLLIAMTLGWFAFVSLLGAHKGSGLLQTYGYLAVGAAAMMPKHLSGFKFLKGLITHPANLVQAFWHKRLNLFAHTAPSGLVGTFTTWTFGVCLVVLLQTTLAAGTLFSFEPFQNLAVVVFVSVGTIVALVWFATRYSTSRRVNVGIFSVLLAFGIAWGAIWIPAAVPNWIRVSSAQASQLSTALNKIPEGAEVIAQGGISGRFAQRSSIYILGGTVALPVTGRWVWFVLGPAAGIELDSARQGTSYVEQLAGPLHAQLEVHGDGIWVFRWHRPAGVHTIRMSRATSTIDAWAIPTNGRLVLDGPGSQWHVASLGREGYLTYGDYWTVPKGRYEARVRLASTSALNVEVWNATSGQLIARSHTVPTQGVADVDVEFTIPRTVKPPPSFSGLGPFTALRLPPPPEDQLEIRVWEPSGARADVYSVSLVHANAP